MAGECGGGNAAAQRALGAVAPFHWAPEDGDASDGDDGTLDTPSGTEDPDAATAAVRVCVRFRPLLESEISSGASALRLRWDEELRLVHACKGDGSLDGGHVERTFEFDHVFGPDVAQEDVFDRAGLSRFLDRVVEGFHATVFAYGQTGSGKTHTMEGFEYAANKSGKGQPRAQTQNVPPDRLGLVPRAINALFTKIGQCQLTDADVFTVRLSFLQIYNERVFDLLNPGHVALATNAGGAGGGLRMRWNVRDAAVTVENLFVFECRTAAEALEHYRAGIRSRAVSSHQMNQASSRSHCVLMLAVERASAAASVSDMGDLRIAKLTLVDLAGSERQGAGVAGKTLRESVSINQSLFVLRKVITALAQRRGQELALVPYRESKLTTLLREALGGSSYALMMACTSPNDSHYEETLSTLHYAMTTGRVRNRPAVNLDPKSAAIRELRAQVRALRQRLAATQTYVVRATGRPLPPELEQDLDDGAEATSGLEPPVQALPDDRSAAVEHAVPPQVWEATPLTPLQPRPLPQFSTPVAEQPPTASTFGTTAPPLPAPPLPAPPPCYDVELRRWCYDGRIDERELTPSGAAEPGGASLSWPRRRESAPAVPRPVPNGLPTALWEIWVDQPHCALSYATAAAN